MRVYLFITLVSCFVYFECAGSVRISLAGWVYISCVGLRCVECRAGKIYLSASWIGWRDCTGFSLFRLSCSGCGTIEMVGGVVLLFLLFSSLCCQLFWRADVCGRAPFFYIEFLLGYIIIRFAVSYFVSC